MNTPSPSANQPLHDAVRASLQQYFHDLGGVPATGVHAMVISAVERALYEEVLAQAGGNQSRAAQWLGINRNTLRRKLLDYGLAS